MIDIDTKLAWISASILAIALFAVLVIVQMVIVRHRRKHADTARPAARMGTIFFLADESGSTSPTDHDWMDNVVIDLLVEAGAMRRDFVYIGFNHTVSESRIFRFPRGLGVASALAELTTHDQPGGTDYNPPLRRVIAHLDTGERGVDIVLFTDGMGPTIAPDITAVIAHARRYLGTRVHLIQPADAIGGITAPEAVRTDILTHSGLDALIDTAVLVNTSITMRNLPVDITGTAASTS